MKKIGIGVIGLGFGKDHLEGYKSNPHTEIIGVCDTNKDLLEEKAKKYNARVAATDYRKLMEYKDIDLVSVVTPDHFHCEQSVAAMESGKHVLCEKPMTPSLEDCIKIINTTEKTKRKFMVGQVCRFAPGFVKTKELIDTGEIGELFFVESEYAHNYSKVPGAGNWRKDPVKKRDPFLGGSCHAVDLLRWIAGDVEEVFAYSNHKCLPDWPVNDCTIAIFKFKKEKIIGKVLSSIGCLRPYTMRSVFYGTKGTIVSDNTSPHIQISKGEDFTSIPVDIASHNVGKEIREIVECIIEDKPVVTDAKEGTMTVATCLAVTKSVKTGKPEKVDYAL